MAKRNIRASQKDCNLKEAPELDQDDDEADIDIYGAEDDNVEGESDVDSVDLDGEVGDIDDIDDADISSDDDAIDGQSVDGPEEGEEDMEDMLRQVLDILQNHIADEEDEEDEEGEEMDLDGEEDEDDDYPGDEPGEDEDESEDDEEDEESEDEDEYEESIEEEADPSAWNGKMQKLKPGKGQDSKQQEVIKDPSVAKSSKTAKKLPGGKAPSGQEGNTDYGKDVLGSSDKANNAAPKATAPKAQAIADVVKKMLSSNSNTIQALYKGDTKLKAMEAVNFGVSDEEMSALAESEGLSDEGKEIARKIVEDNVRKKVAEALDVIDARYALSLSEEADAREAALIDRLDEYLDYTVESYFEENKVAIEEGVRHELSDSFLEGIKHVFESHYVEVPRSKVDKVAQLEEQVAEKDEKIKKITRRAIQLRKEARNLKRDQIISEASAGLSVNEAGKLHSLAEDMQFDGDVSAFKSKVKRLREAHFGKRTVKNPEPEFEALAEQIEQRGTDSISRYVDTINRTTNK